MKNKKGFIAIAVASAMLKVPSQTYASGLIEMDSLIEYLNTVLPVYIADVAENGWDITYSDPIPVSEGVNHYVVFQSDSILGMLTVGELDGKYTSSFDANDEKDVLFQKLQIAYEMGETVSTRMVNGVETVVSDDSSALYSKSGYVQLDKTNALKSTASSSGSCLYYKQLNTTVVKNSTNKDNGQGLCWLASVLTKYNYEYNNNVPVGYLLNALKQKYGAIPVGTPTWILRAYSYYYGNNVIKRIDGMMTYSEITQKLQNDMPIHVSLRGVDTSNEEVGHGVVLSGIKIYNGYSLYYIDDPNKTGHQAVYVSSDTMNARDDLTYYTSTDYSNSTIYTKWIRSYCQ